MRPIKFSRKYNDKPKATIYISAKELKRINRQAKMFSVRTSDKLLAIRVCGFVGFNDMGKLFDEIVKFKKKKLTK